MVVSRRALFKFPKEVSSGKLTRLIITSRRIANDLALKYGPATTLLVKWHEYNILEARLTAAQEQIAEGIIKGLGELFKEAKGRLVSVDGKKIVKVRKNAILPRVLNHIKKYPSKKHTATSVAEALHLSSSSNLTQSLNALVESGELRYIGKIRIAKGRYHKAYVLASTPTDAIE